LERCRPASATLVLGLGAGEPINGRMVFVRYVWSDMTPTSAHFEQSFSDDGGKTWEVNWITTHVRVP
jgi:hypothetical protein